MLLEGYKESPVGVIPADWSFDELKSFIEIKHGYAFPGEHFGDKGAILLTPGNFKRTGGLYFNERNTKRFNSDYPAEYELKADDLVVVMTDLSVKCEILGNMGLVTEDEPLLHNQRIGKINFLSNSLSKEYLLYLAQAEDYKRYIQNTATGTTVRHSSPSKILDAKVAVPPLPEQKKIAQILSTVDSKLTLIDQQIAATQTLKKGLMQKLFSEGVGTQDADGNWQPHTEFKDSELGRIPVGWEVTLLDKLANRGSGHTPDKQKPEYWNGGIKWISLADSSKLDQGPIDTTDKEISSLGIDNSSATLHPKGTVVLSRDAGIGKSAVMDQEMAVSQHFIVWNCEPKGLLNNWYLYYLLQLMKPEFERIAIGSTIKTIGLPFFKKLRIAHPSNMAEQKQIAKILSTVDCKLNRLNTKKSQTQQLKKGLMQKLLTGQIRVKPDSQDY
ncbi:MAG: restriction endonuclease subunit S [Endozoicomonas sp.]|uniref:restriction endonuclease subunit S n=1 Tax=Endozoicomonas sp. TaxID=1892382 RepID=UPI003D9BB931